jgi:hypothetical protein
MEMKQAVSRLLGKEALSFNDEVAKLYERPWANWSEFATALAGSVRLLEVPPTGYTATANSNLNPGRMRPGRE